MFYTVFTHKMLVTAFLMPVGLVLAWKFWRVFGFKALIVYYLLRTAFILLGYHLYPSTIASDLPGWMQHAEWMAFHGYIPGKDFLSPYNIGFNALLAGAVKAYHSYSSITILFSIAEFFGIWFLARFLHQAYGDCVSKRTVILYLTSPLCYCSAIGSQDETLILLGISAALYFGCASRRALSSITLFLTFLFTKVLAPFYMVPMVFIGRRRTLAFLGGGALLLYIGLVACGIRPLSFRFGRVLGMDGAADMCSEMQCNGNVWALFPMVPTLLKYGLGLFVLMVLVSCFVGWFCREETISRYKHSVLVSLLFVASMYYFLPGCWPFYMLPVLPFAYLFALIDVDLKMPRALKVLITSLWGWTLFYCGKDQPWLPDALKYPYLVFYNLLYCSVVFVLCYALRMYMSTPFEGIAQYWNSIVRNDDQGR